MTPKAALAYKLAVIACGVLAASVTLSALSNNQLQFHQPVLQNPTMPGIDNGNQSNQTPNISISGPGNPGSVYAHSVTTYPVSMQISGGTVKSMSIQVQISNDSGNPLSATAFDLQPLGDGVRVYPPINQPGTGVIFGDKSFYMFGGWQQDGDSSVTTGMGTTTNRPPGNYSLGISIVYPFAGNYTVTVTAS